MDILVWFPLLVLANLILLMADVYFLLDSVLASWSETEPEFLYSLWPNQRAKQSFVHAAVLTTIACFVQFCIVEPNMANYDKAKEEQTIEETSHDVTAPVHGKRKGAIPSA